MKKGKICPRCKIRERVKGKNKYCRSYCEVCIKEYYQENKEKIKRDSKKYKRIYRQEHKDRVRAYQKTPDRRKKQVIRDFTRDFYKKNKIKKVKCLFCGSKENLEFHHHDYNKPKEFIILCKKCHQKEHNKPPIDRK